MRIEGKGGSVIEGESTACVFGAGDRRKWSYCHLNQDALDKIVDGWGLCDNDYTPKHEIGERLVLPNGWVFQYGKVDFGNEMVIYKWVSMPI